MEMRSSAFFIGNPLPYKYTCDGEDISPPLQWEDPPHGTRSFVLILEDLDASQPDFTHWILYNLPPECRALPEAIFGASTLPQGGMEGTNDYGRIGFGGPCPPEDTGTHRYFFKLYAIDRLLDLPVGANQQEVRQAMQGHVLDKAELMARYTRQDYAALLE